MVSISFTLYFEDPFWIALIEEVADGHARIAKVVFGAEPSNPEIAAFVREKLSAVSLHEVADSEASATARRVAKDKSQGRTKRSLEVYKAALCAERTDRKAANRKLTEALKEEEFKRKQLKKKQKRRGH